MAKAKAIQSQQGVSDPSRAVIGSFIAMMAGGQPIGIFSTGFLMSALTSEFGWARSFYSTGILAGMLLGAVILPLVGRIADRFGPRRLLLASSTVFALLIAAMSTLNGSKLQFLLLFTAFGGVSMALGPVVYSRLVAGWTDKRRGIALALALSGNAAGAIVVSLLMAQLIAASGWRTACLVLAGYAFVLPVFAITFLTRDPPLESLDRTAEDTDLPGLALGEARRTRAFWIIAGIMALNGFAVNGLSPHLVSLTGDRGVTAGSAALVLGAFGVGQFAGRIGSGLLLDRSTRGAITSILLGLGATGMCLLLFGGGMVPVLALATLLFGIGYGADAEVAAYLCGRYFGIRHYGQILAVFMAVFMASSAAGPILFGFAADRLGSYDPVLALACASIGTSACLALFLGRYTFDTRH